MYLLHILMESNLAAKNFSIFMDKRWFVSNVKS